MINGDHHRQRLFTSTVDVIRYDMIWYDMIWYDITICLHARVRCFHRTWDSPFCWRPTVIVQCSIMCNGRTALQLHNMKRTLVIEFAMHLSNKKRTSIKRLCKTVRPIARTNLSSSFSSSSSSCCCCCCDDKTSDPSPDKTLYLRVAYAQRRTSVCNYTNAHRCGVPSQNKVERLQASLESRWKQRTMSRTGTCLFSKADYVMSGRERKRITNWKHCLIVLWTRQLYCKATFGCPYKCAGPHTTRRPRGVSQSTDRAADHRDRYNRPMYTRLKNSMTFWVWWTDTQYCIMSEWWPRTKLSLLLVIIIIIIISVSISFDRTPIGLCSGTISISSQMTQCRIILLLQPITKLYLFTMQLKFPLKNVLSRV